MLFKSMSDTALCRLLFKVSPFQKRAIQEWRRRYPVESLTQAYSKWQVK